jgi:hypothetical protein
MHSKVLLVGLLISAGPQMLQSQEEVLPSLFNAKPPLPSTQSSPQPRTPISEIARQRITGAVLAAANVSFSPHGVAGHTTPTNHEVIQMAPFVVAAPEIRARLTPKADTNALRFLKTGTLFYRSGQHFDTRLSFHAWILETPPGTPQNTEFTQYELRLNFRF